MSRNAEDYQAAYVGEVGDWAMKHHGPAIVLVSDSQDREAIEDCLNLPEGEFGCYFVEIGEGDYRHVWGCTKSVPYNYAAMFDLSANIPQEA